MAATIRDISKKTGLALATISKYLNGGNVLPENRKAIAEAIEELHYERNEVARGLATSQTKTVGVLIHSFENVFAGTIVSTIEGLLREHGYGTIVCDCQEDEQQEAEEIRFLLSKRVDGIITFPTASGADYLEPAKERGIPVILLDRTFREGNFDSVLVDNKKAAGKAVQVLLDYGHERIAIICGGDGEYTARERLLGYRDALKAAAIPEREAYMKKGQLTVEHGYLAMKELLALQERPTAVFLSNYEITLGGIIAVNEENISFPKEISLIGFDNFMLSKVVNPPLWMVSQPMEQIAREAAQLMLERLERPLEDGEEPRRIVLDTGIYEGKSILNIRNDTL